jgi:hypothetical protein
LFVLLLLVLPPVHHVIQSQIRESVADLRLDDVVHTILQLRDDFCRLLSSNRRLNSLCCLSRSLSRYLFFCRRYRLIALLVEKWEESFGTKNSPLILNKM